MVNFYNINNWSRCGSRTRRSLQESYLRVYNVYKVYKLMPGEDGKWNTKSGLPICASN